MKKRNVLKWGNRVISTVLMTLLVSVAAMVVFTSLSGGEPEVFGYQLKTVLSGSMEPEIQTGSIIAVESIDGSEEAATLQNGDVITFVEEENRLITHRITEVDTTENGVLYTTKGDNNNAVDSNPVLAENVVGVYSGVTIPYVGYVVNFAQSPEGSALLLILPGMLLFGYSIVSIWRTLNTLEKKQETETVDAK
ncbi:signal peptidase [Virgibacillus natechei]|uniref:Signal peptidase I n=1 Tax=Virgibacillus natechei TaxID=1216297 RepID=A0ABS4IJT7_9BACI|nr:signal peptidase I [Virgibacillus natechei]MBP1971187.1 signal peptidase [Virgibacillus natechei]UZD11934.1 signal peptidase I [Virgibacillus natechei]